MNTREMLDLTFDHLVGSKFCAVVFWIAVVATIIARVYNSADAMTTSMIFVIMMGMGYLYNKSEFQRTRVELAKAIGIDHLLER